MSGPVATMKAVVRLILALGLGMATCFASAPPGVSLRGTLIQEKGKPPAIEKSDHQRIVLSGDQHTMQVLNDVRLKGDDFEVIGHFTGAGRFTVDPIDTEALFVHKNGKKLEVTYYCQTCNLRYYWPGKCVCCQQETQLDLIDPKDH
jgi:hypothetical protein